MRIFFTLAFFLLGTHAHATCNGQDLRPDMSAEMRSELTQALADIPFPEGNHWVAKKDTTVLHLIGTLHANDPRMDAVVDRLAPTLSQADAFYFEVTQAEMAQFEQNLAKDLSPVVITSGPTLIDLMPEESWGALTAMLSERGIPGWMAAKLRPWFLSVLLAVPPCMAQNPDADRGMDARLTELAELHGIPQHSLERIEDVIALFDSHPIEEQVQSLVRLADALNAGEDQLATVANAYLEEKHAEIIQLARLQGLDASGLTREEFDAEWQGFEQQLLIQRNTDWMRHILALKDQTVVIAVGAGHLSDTHGLLSQLQKAGFSLTREAF